ncbi:hypothetical protein RRG08_011978 [Elysia crispata]|uniref:Uncharacterized protein n=1 Tax=Elysia crispata TaxID=231223 RepID=A0AAE1DG53_9GAST|nr:hypothetical protein RRG08_011978 [Elysia crispata]
MISVVVLIFRIHETCTHCKRLYKADLTRSLDCTAKVKASLCHGLQGTVDVGFAGMKEMRLEGLAESVVRRKSRRWLGTTAGHGTRQECD